MDNHYKIRMRGMVFFVDNWNGGDKVYFEVDGTSVLNKTYSGSGSAYVTCGSGSHNSGSCCGINTTAKERYLIFDTYDINHNATSLTIDVTTDWCSCWSTNIASCKPCNWMLPDFILMWR
jgi:hypothetical protein